MAKRQRLILSIIRYFLIISSFILLCSSLISHAESTEITEYKLINTASGVIRGKADVTIFNGRKYFAFKGIPYANAPVGDLRFKVIEFFRNSEKLKNCDFCFSKKMLSKKLTGEFVFNFTLLLLFLHFELF